MIPTTKKEFGFLPHKISGNFDCVELSVLPDFDQVFEWIGMDSNEDGYYYPPIISKYSFDLSTGKIKEEIPRSSRPASVFNLPPSHLINITNPVVENDPTISDEALIIHALAFLYGTRLQFKEWRFDTRVPIKPLNKFSLVNQTALHFLEHLYDRWRHFSSDIRTKIINIFYFHSRARCTEWEWEEFIYHYMVLDSIFKIHLQLNSVSRKLPHSERIRHLCEFYGIRYDTELLKILIAMRNELFHEALWAGMPLGFNSTNRSVDHLHQHLRRLNERLICGIIGYNNQFSRTGWWFMGTVLFDRYES